MHFPGDSDGKASAYNAGDPGFNPSARKISWRRKWQPTPVLFLKSPMDGGARWTAVPGAARVQHMDKMLYFSQTRSIF